MSRSPKRVSNEKADYGDYVIYYMRRLIGSQVRGYNLAVTRHELEHRDRVAWRLRDARKHLAREVTQARGSIDVRQMTLPEIALVFG